MNRHQTAGSSAKMPENSSPTRCPRVTGPFVKSIGCHASRGVRIDESQALAIERARTGCRNYQHALAAQLCVSAVVQSRAEMLASSCP
jgi:hypothetical protein